MGGSRESSRTTRFVWTFLAFPFIGCSGKEFQDRSFRRCVPCVTRHVPSCLRNRKEEHPKKLRHETPFPNTLSARKRSDERCLHKVPAPCSQARPFFTCRTQTGYPQKLQHETPYPDRLSERPILNKGERQKVHTNREFHMWFANFCVNQPCFRLGCRKRGHWLSYDFAL